MNLCPACAAAVNPETRTCELCDELVCRHAARKASLRLGGDDFDFHTGIVCKEWERCVVRHAKRVIK